MSKPDLSPRQLQVVRLFSLGCTASEIAKILRCATSTVENHKTAAMTKLGVGKMALMTRLAIKMRISHLNERLTPLEKRRSGRKDDGWN